MNMPGDARAWIESVYGNAAVIPEALGANANRAEGDHWAARSQGGANVVKLSAGYTRGDVIDWWSEARTPSRLGEASTTVVLARWEGIELRPWVEHDKAAAAWAYSSVRVPARLIAQRADGSTPRREDALCELEATLPGAGKWAVLLPLEQDSSGLWRGSARTAEAKHRPSKSSEWAYSASRGLTPSEEQHQEDSE